MVGELDDALQANAATGEGSEHPRWTCERDEETESQRRQLRPTDELILDERTARMDSGGKVRVRRTVRAARTVLEKDDVVAGVDECLAGGAQVAPRDHLAGAPG
jgi:hypothetical protein